MLSRLVTWSSALALGLEVIAVCIPKSPPTSAPLITAPFVSYACEYNGFLNFTGDDYSGPNSFSYQLINNLGDISGTKPSWRIGGNSADLAVYIANQTTPVITYKNAAGTTNLNVTTGPDYFTGFKQWPGVKFIHNFNQKYNGTLGRQNLLDEVDVACTVLNNENVWLWEFGNEADLYVHAGARPAGWDEEAYITEWLNGTAAIKDELARVCACNYSAPKFIAPTFGQYGAPFSNLNAVTVAQDNVTRAGNIDEWSLHLYMPGAAPTLQGTLMNHTLIKSTIAARTNQSSQMKAVDNLPFSITEANNILNIGVANLSDVFGSALWAMDFQLYAASTGLIQRMHMQQGSAFFYNSWQPITHNNQTQGVRPAYYGDLASTTALGQATDNDVAISEVVLGSNDTESAYAIYENGSLARLAVINLEAYNMTTGGRPNATYTFQLDTSCDGTATGMWLTAPDSNSHTGTTFNGKVYDDSTGVATPVGNSTCDVPLSICDGILTLDVPHSSAVVVKLCCQ